MKLIISEEGSEILTIDISETSVIVNCPNIAGFHVDATSTQPPVVTFDLPTTATGVQVRTTN